MSKFGSRLIQSAKEARAIARGEMEPAKAVQAEDIDVAAIRKALGLSQDKFAARFHLSPAAIRDWEQKRRRPDRSAILLLKVIEHSPETVEQALNKDRHCTAEPV